MEEIETLIELCQSLEAKMDEIVDEIKQCIELLSKDGNNTKAEVKKRLESLVEGVWVKQNLRKTTKKKKGESYP